MRTWLRLLGIAALAVGAAAGAGAEQYNVTPGTTATRT
jgi:hypothetical protein